MKITSFSSRHSYKCVSILVGFGVCANTWLRGESATLTVEETLGAVFLLKPESVAFANPQAKPRLYQLLDHKEVEDYHSKIYAMLGHIGNGTDATNLEWRLKNNYVGMLKPAEWRAVQSVLWSLSKMASRRVDEASEILDKMTKRAYWEDIRFQSVEGMNVPHGIVNEMIIQSLLACARSGETNWQQRAQALQESVEDPTTRNTINWRLDPLRVAQHVKEFREAKVLTIPPETRRRLSKAFNSYFDKPSLVPIEELRGTNHAEQTVQQDVTTNGFAAIQGAELVRLSKEAQDAFSHIIDYFLNDRYEECAKTLADNGKPLIPLDKQTQASIATTAAKLRAMTRDIEVTKKLLRELRAAGVNFGTPQAQVLADETLTVTIPCLGSREVKRHHLPRHVRTRTTDGDDQLVVYMIRQNGHWYWNPFGW